MNPISSYDELLLHIKKSKNKKDIFLPIILIKPVKIEMLNKNNQIDYIFDYFDYRAGEDVQFFMPGYLHCFCEKLKPYISDQEPFSYKATAINISRLGNIYFNNKDFIDFIHEIEKQTRKFIYFGATELLLLKIAYASDNKFSHIDYSKIYRYSLSSVFKGNNSIEEDEITKMSRVEYFLEMVIRVLKEAKNEETAINSIDLYYTKSISNEMDDFNV